MNGLYSLGPCFNCGRDVWRMATLHRPPEPCEFDCIYCGRVEYTRLTPAQYRAMKGEQ